MTQLEDIRPGDTIGRYEFLVPVAQGGMASVWAARLRGTRGFAKTVAIKTMLPAVKDDPTYQKMFFDEAHIASRLNHPNAAQILDLGEEQGVLYLVMEWIDGEPLSAIRRAREAPLPIPIATRIVVDACAGLHAAHELKDDDDQLLRLVHRDISPQNILVTYDGLVKVVDFGVIKAAGRTVGDTRTGTIKGKPAYMSPEQALAERVDRRTDIFALGIVLYQATLPIHPFRGKTNIATLRNIVSNRPIKPPRLLDPSYPEALEAVVFKALAYDRKDRFSTALELSHALEEAVPHCARTTDVADYLEGLCGMRASQRRTTLRSAIQIADRRSLASVETVERAPVDESVDLTDPIQPAFLDEEEIEPTLAHPFEFPTTPASSYTPLGVPTAARPGPRRSVLLWMLTALLASITVVVGGLVVREAIHHRPSEPHDEAQPPAVAVRPAVAPAEVHPNPESAPEPSSSSRPDARTIVPGPLPKPAVPAPASEREPEPAPPPSSEPDLGGFVPPPIVEPGF